MFKHTILFVAATLAVLFLVNSAEARRYKAAQGDVIVAYTYDHSSGEYHQIGVKPVVKKQSYRRVAGRNRTALRIDKSQEYVVKKDGGLIKREDYELTRAGMIRVITAYGKPITVNPVDASKFLKFFALLHERGYKINWGIVGCYASGGHKSGSNHHIGRACDIQTGWNRAPDFMFHVGDLIRQAGLYDGCSFGDCGHVEAVRGLYNKKPNLYTSLAKFKGELSTASYQP